MYLYALIFRQGTLVHEIMHGIFVFPLLIILYSKTKSLRQVVIALLVTYLLDLDHLVDYFYYHGFTFDIYRFFANNYFVGHISFVPLHGWEWLAIVSYFASKKGWNSIYTPIAFGMFAHLLLDSINVGSFLFYSFIYRYITLIHIFG